MPRIASIRSKTSSVSLGATSIACIFSRTCAARLAPVIAFPYIRSLVTLVTANSGEAVILPVTNVGAMFSPDQVDIGTGIPYWVAGKLDLGIGTMTWPSYDYGTTYLWVCGLLNYLIVLDAFDIAQGRKP